MLTATHNAAAQWKMTNTYYVLKVLSPSLKTHCGTVEALGLVGAQTAARERFGLGNVYEIRARRNGGVLLRNTR